MHRSRGSLGARDRREGGVPFCYRWTLVRIVGLGIAICAGLLLLDAIRVPGSPEQMTAKAHLEHIAIAIHYCNDKTGELPNNSYSPGGKPLLSWRVHLLPYLGEDDLYQQFNLDEPWDSPNNIRLLNQMPKVYQSPNETPGSSKTYYRGFANAGAMFEPRPTRMRQPGEGAVRKKEELFCLKSLKDSARNNLGHRCGNSRRVDQA